MIRRASPDDVATLRVIEVECFGATAWSDRSITHAVNDPHQDVVVSIAGDAYGVARVAGDTADLDRIAGLPGARRQGVSRMLLDELMHRARERGASRMLLEVAADNAGALALYASAGFIQIHRRARYYRGGVAALVMERSLEEQP